jgi:hypothetical protein
MVSPKSRLLPSGKARLKTALLTCGAMSASSFTLAANIQAEEARLYSYKVDQTDGGYSPIVVDGHNHTIDALRYALAPIIQNADAGWILEL